MSNQEITLDQLVIQRLSSKIGYLETEITRLQTINEVLNAKLQDIEKKEEKKNSKKKGE